MFMEMHGKNMIFRIKKDCKLYIMNEKYKSTKKKKFNIAHIICKQI